MQRRSPDFWSGLALAALGGYIVNEARRWDYLTPDGPGLTRDYLLRRICASMIVRPSS